MAGYQKSCRGHQAGIPGLRGQMGRIGKTVLYRAMHTEAR